MTTKQEAKSLNIVHEVINTIFTLNKLIENLPFEIEFEYGYDEFAVKVTPFSDELGSIPLGILFLDSQTLGKDKTALIKNLTQFVNNVVLPEDNENENNTLATRLTTILLEVKKAQFLNELEEFWEFFNDAQDMQQEEILSSVPAINQTAH